MVGYELPGGRAAWVTWAVASSGENGTAQVTLQSDATLQANPWNNAITGDVTALPSNGGVVTVDVTSAPQIVVEVQ